MATTSKRITLAGLQASAKDLGVPLSTLKAVLDVESSGSGFLKSGKPKILFEGHIFHKRTGGRFSASHPTISYRTWTKRFYKGGEREWSRFNEAFKLDPEAAMRATSWGLGQIIGDNFKAAGFKTVGEFVDAMKRGEDQQMQAMVDFIQSNHLDDELQSENWAGFARGYNGPGYKKNKYDSRLATAKRKHLRDDSLPMNQVPDQQEELVADLQQDEQPETDLLGPPAEQPQPVDVPKDTPEQRAEVTNIQAIPPMPVKVPDWAKRIVTWGAGINIGGLGAAFGFFRDNPQALNAFLEILKWGFIALGGVIVLVVIGVFVKSMWNLKMSNDLNIARMQNYGNQDTKNVDFSGWKAAPDRTEVKL